MDINLNVTQAAVANAPAISAVTPTSRPVAAPDVSAQQSTDQGPRDLTLEEAVGSLQASVAAGQRNLEFSIDESTGEQVVKVVATQTGEIVRQMPSEVALKLAQSLKDGNSPLFNDWA